MCVGLIGAAEGTFAIGLPIPDIGILPTKGEGFKRPESLAQGYRKVRLRKNWPGLILASGGSSTLNPYKNRFFRRGAACCALARSMIGTYIARINDFAVALVTCCGQARAGRARKSVQIRLELELWHRKLCGFRCVCPQLTALDLNRAGQSRKAGFDR
jgi:hypothetical protein